MAVLRVGGNPAYDEVIGLGYDYNTVSFAPVRLKIGSTYVPFSNYEPSGWKYSTIQKIKLTKDGVEYKPIKKRQYIKFNIVLAPGPYNTPGSAVSLPDAANSNSAHAYPQITDTYIISDPGYHITLFGYASIHNSNALQVYFCALGSTKVSANDPTYKDYNAIVDSIEASYGAWEWWMRSESFLTSKAKIWWKLVTCSSNTSTIVSAYSGQQKNSTGGSDGWVRASADSAGEAFGSFYSYKDGWWGSNPWGGSVSYFTYDSANDKIVPNRISHSDRSWEGNYHFYETISAAALSVIDSGSVDFSGISRQYIYSWQVNVGSEATPEYQTRYSCAGSSTASMTQEVTVWLD